MFKSKFNSMKTLSKYVLFSFFIIIVYSIAEFAISTMTSVAHDTLTVALYGFFGTEIALCGFIKIFKIKKEEV